MACDHPLRAFRSKTIDPETGRRGVTFKTRDAQDGLDPFEVPCGQCTGCRLEHSRQWAVRLMHEASQHEFNCWLTLTYNDQSIPQNYGLEPAHLRNFLKLYRQHVHRRHCGGKIKFFACGEYGDETLRPHYHVCIFGHDFPDKTKWKRTELGHQSWRSEQLEKLWTYGNSEIGSLTSESAGYTARYTLKKVNGDKAFDHYARISPIDGQPYNVHPEFSRMSKGLGLSWFTRYRGDVFPSGFIVVDGTPQPPPRYYLKKLDDYEQEELSSKAWTAALPHRANNTKERRAVRAAVRDARISRLKRNLG